MDDFNPREKRGVQSHHVLAVIGAGLVLVAGWELNHFWETFGALGGLLLFVAFAMYMNGAFDRDAND